jgi:hypothetical protein
MTVKEKINEALTFSVGVDYDIWLGQGRINATVLKVGKTTLKVKINYIRTPEVIYFTNFDNVAIPYVNVVIKHISWSEVCNRRSRS